VLLEDQDRARWDRRLIAEGEAILSKAPCALAGRAPISCMPPSISNRTAACQEDQAQIRSAPAGSADSEFAVAKR